MRKTRRVLTTEFKQECVKLVVNQGYTIVQAASAMRVSLSSMQRWASHLQLVCRPLKNLATHDSPSPSRHARWRWYTFHLKLINCRVLCKVYTALQ